MTRARSFIGATLLILGSCTVWGPANVATNVGVQLKPSAVEFERYVESIPGSNVRFTMLPVPGGAFLMGSRDGEPGRASDEGPQHQVTVRPFWMGALEVTWDEYDLFAFSRELNKDRRLSAPAVGASADAITHPTPPYADESFGYGKGRQPVISVTYHAAMEYCRWLSLKTGKTYRLPTEAEWEYACRAGSKTAYSFGDDPKKLHEHAWYLDNSDGAPHPGGRKKPNAWGFYDLHGNVGEWCIDRYDKDFYSHFRSISSVLSPVLVPGEKRYPHVVRGGSWDDESQSLRSAARKASRKEWSKRDPQSPQSIWWHTEAITVGFRVARPLDEQENLKGYRSKITRQSPD